LPKWLKNASIRAQRVPVAIRVENCRRGAFMALASDRLAWPTEIRLRKDKRTLHLVFDSGESFEFPAEFLRVHSPSAEVQGHSPSERVTVGGKRDVTIREVHPVGNYAVRLVFVDGHATGIFSWEYFLKIGRDQDRMWAEYLAELAAKGLSREQR
jgi:DUF971 family protein